MPIPEQSHCYRGSSPPPDKPSSSPNKLDVLNKVEQAVGEIQDSDTFGGYLEVLARFHRYSWGNIALVLAQIESCPVHRHLNDRACRKR